MRAVNAGPADLPVGGARIVRVPQGEPPRISVIVTRLESGWRAYWNVCKHLPIPLDGGFGALPDGLVCISHGARYRAEDGLCVSGPCRGALLDSVDVRVEDGQLVVSVD